MKISFKRKMFRVILLVILVMLSTIPASAKDHDGLYTLDNLNIGQSDLDYNIYTKNIELLENNSITNSAVRNMSWGVTNFLAYVSAGCENLYDTVFGFINWTESEDINRIVGNFKPILYGLLAVSIFYLGALYLFNAEKKPKIGSNIILMFIAILGINVIFSTLNDLTLYFKEGVEGIRVTSASAEGTKYSTFDVVNNNMIDLTKIDTKFNGLENVNFRGSSNTKDYYGIGVKDFNEFKLIDYLAVLNPDSEIFTYRGKTKDILSNKIVLLSIEGGKYKVVPISNGFGFNSADDSDIGNEFYYRYYARSIDMWIQLASLIVVFLTISYKIIRLIYELSVSKFLATFYSVDISGGEKLRRIFAYIRDCYIVLCFCTISILLYKLLSFFVIQNTTGFTASLLLLMIAFCVIDGPNIIERLLGIDAGLKSSTARMLAIYKASKSAISAPTNTLRKGTGIARGDVREGGMLGYVVGMTFGRKGENGKRYGGLSNFTKNMDKNIKNGEMKRKNSTENSSKNSSNDKSNSKNDIFQANFDKNIKEANDRGGGSVFTKGDPKDAKAQFNKNGMFDKNNGFTNNKNLQSQNKYFASNKEHEFKRTPSTNKSFKGSYSINSLSSYKMRNSNINIKSNNSKNGSKKKK